MLALKNGDTWVLGEPFFKSYFVSVELNNHLIRLVTTYAQESELLSPFKTTEGWMVMITLGIGSIVVYILAFCVYLKYEEHKKKQIAFELANTVKKPRIL